MAIKMENKQYVTLYENLCNFSDIYFGNKFTQYPAIQQDISQLISSFSNIRQVIGILNTIDEKSDSNFTDILNETFLYLTKVEDTLSYVLGELPEIVEEI